MHNACRILSACAWKTIQNCCLGMQSLVISGHCDFPRNIQSTTVSTLVKHTRPTENYWCSCSKQKRSSFWQNKIKSQIALRFAMNMALKTFLATTINYQSITERTWFARVLRTKCVGVIRTYTPSPQFIERKSVWEDHAIKTVWEKKQCLTQSGLTHSSNNWNSVW